MVVVDDSYCLSLVDGLRKSFNSGKTKSIEWRKKQLKGLLKFYEEKGQDLAEALEKDLGKPKQESYLAEIQFNETVTKTVLNEFEDWVQDEPAEKNFVTILDKIFCHWEPLGVILILAPWNYPVQLSLAPAAGALAAGNCLIIKPSEISSATAEVIQNHLPKYLDNDCVKVVCGGIEETTSLLKVKYDHIFFTGGLNVGKIVATAAAKHLTPVTLELGGKCPLYFDGDSIHDLTNPVKRLIWGKMLNAGQTCVAPDYIVCSPETADRLIATIKEVLEEFYNDDFETDYCRIINDRQFKRLDNLLNGSDPKLNVISGPIDPSKRLMGLQVLNGISLDDPVMGEEIFGPLLPIIHVNNVDEAIEIINRGSKPLSLYVFSQNEKIQQKIIKNTSSGSVCCNDVIVQLSVEALPFGGVGDSGYGRYHGKYTFETFSHKKAIAIRDFGFIGETVGNFRYPPYADWKINRGKLLLRGTGLPKIPTFIKASFLIFSGIAINSLYRALSTKYDLPVPEWM